MHFADKLLKTIESTSPICVWIDPILSKIPSYIKISAQQECWEWTIEAAWLALSEFCIWIIDSMDWLAWICKIQIAFFEMYWSHWIQAYEEVCNYAKEKSLIIITDWKRNDIWSTSEAYANGFLWEVDLFWKNVKLSNTDALTINPYLWKWIFILVKTSNPSSSDFQDLSIWDEMLSEKIARNVSNWWMWDLWKNYFSSIWAVVWATHIEDAKYLRSLMPNQIFLVPWYKTQWWWIEWVKACFNSDKLWAIINSSRAINYAYLTDNKYSEKNFIEASRNEIIRMKADIDKI